MPGRSGSRGLYDTPEWRALAKQVLERDPWCRGPCEGVNASRIADHIKPVKQGGAALDPENVQGLCRPCHQLKSRGEQTGGKAKQHKRLVQGVDPDTGVPLGGWWGV